MLAWFWLFFSPNYAGRDTFLTMKPSKSYCTLTRQFVWGINKTKLKKKLSEVFKLRMQVNTKGPQNQWGLCFIPTERYEVNSFLLFVGPLEAFIWLTRCPFVDMLTTSTAYCMSVPIYSMSARSVGINLPQVGRTAVLSQSLEEDSTRGRLSSSRQAASSLK